MRGKLAFLMIGSLILIVGCKKVDTPMKEDQQSRREWAYMTCTEDHAQTSSKDCAEQAREMYP